MTALFLVLTLAGGVSAAPARVPAVLPPAAVAPAATGAAQQPAAAPQPAATPKHASRHAHAHHHAAAETATPKTPRTSAELLADVNAQLRAGLLAHEDVTATFAGDAITLTGHVHRAENKGQATRVARKVAAHDGWPQVHVFNKVEVD